MSSKIQVDKENDSKRERFFQGIFGENKGFVALAAKHLEKLTEVYFKYPEQLPELLEWINSKFPECDVYFSPHLFSRPDREREFAETCPVAWAEFDIEPNGVAPKPNIIVESSPGKYHYYWGFKTPQAPQAVETISRKLTYTWGADKGGWYLGKLLRVPLTHNFKYPEAPHVKVVQFEASFEYELTDFSELRDKSDFAEFAPEGMPADIDDVPEPAYIFGKHGSAIPPAAFGHFYKAPDSDWSTALWSLEVLLFESGLSKKEVFTIAEKSAVNKYARDHRPRIELWIEVCKAEQSVKARRPSKETLAIQNLLTKEERDVVERAPPLFLDRYIKWASSKTDAAEQYHQAGAYTILSSLICESVMLETSVGNIIPNLWFMLLGDTTLTRKTTAMSMAMRLLNGVYEEALMATDASIEGLLTELQNRPGRTSLFLRDEFSGMLDAMARKDYYAGMVEMLAKLYDGERQKRILRKETIDVQNPRFIIFAGGIKSRILELFNLNLVINGFIPRFIFITAEADKANYRPMTAPTKGQEVVSSELLKELSEIREHYNSTQTMQIAGQQFDRRKEFIARLTPDAWTRYAELEQRLVFIGSDSDSPETITPTLQRLCISALKAAVLIAASYQRNPNTVEVGLQDLLIAISYMESWVGYSLEVIYNAGKTSSEKTVERALYLIEHGRSTRADLMSAMHLGSREAGVLLDTLEQRGFINRVRTSGRGERLTLLGRR